MRITQEQELSNGFKGVYALPSVAELEDEVGLHLETPLLAGGESYEFAAIANLDLFFTRVYRYWHERGLSSILLAGALNLLALAFTAAFSTFLLLFVDWRALHAECLAPRAGGGGGGDCDLAAVALDRRPLLGRGVASDLLAVSYISVCVVYLGWTAAHYLMDARDMREVAHFMSNKLGISESKVVTMTWAEVVHKLVLVQRTTRLCIARDLDELHIVSRVMRKENYLIAMINRNVLQLHLQPPPDAPLVIRKAMDAGLRLVGVGCGGGGGGPGSGNGCGGGRGCPPMLTKTLEWNLRWCILDHMFDERFRIRPEFSDVVALKRRLRLVAAANLLLSPFLLMFLLAYFFMRNAERLYHHPAALGSRRWSGLAKWRIRELNELPHYLQHRLSASHPAALRYVAQFPSHTLAALARFMVFTTGSFVALLLLMTFLDESLLERPLLGRQVVWWLGTMTVVLAACRTMVAEEPVAYDPERALADVVSYTHYLPRHWRGRAHTSEVQAAFLSLFRLKVVLFLEELASLVTTPLVLACSLPACADSIVEFVSTFTIHVDGVGDVCSMALFDMSRHGNTKYGAQVQVDKAFRSRQGKLEKSFLTFVATYSTWEPGELGRRMLTALAANGGAGGGGGGGGGGACGSGPGASAGLDAAAAPAGDDPASRPSPDALPFHQDPPTVFPYQVAAGAAKAADTAPAASAAAAAALTRAASGFRSHAKGGMQLALGKDSAGRKGDIFAAGSGGDGFPTAGSNEAVQPAAPSEPGPRRPTAQPGGALRGLRRPQFPLHLQPYHGVKSYMSNASASQLSAAAPAGTSPGWPRRPSAHTSSGGGAPPGPAGSSPAPSVASSQFSNLAAPYLQYYPVPLYYAQQQQLRHIQQQQYQLMYEQLTYGTPSPSPRRERSALSGGGATAVPPGSPLTLPYARQMVNSGGSISAMDGTGWQRQSLPQPFDMYGSYSGMRHPFPFHCPPVVPLPPPLHPHPHFFPNPHTSPPLPPQAHSTDTAYTNPITSIGGAAGAAGTSQQQLRDRSQQVCEDAPAAVAAAAARAPFQAGVSSSGGHTEGSGRDNTEAQQPSMPQLQGRERSLLKRASKVAYSEGMELPSSSVPSNIIAIAMGGESTVGSDAAPSRTPEANRMSSTGPDAAVDGGWGSGVSGRSDLAGGGSKGTATATGLMAAPATARAAALCASSPADITCKGGNSSGSSASASISVHAAGSGSVTALTGRGSDILDLQGLETAPPALADDEDDPLGGFVKLPAAPPPPPLHPWAALGQDAALGVLEDVDGFGIVPGAAPHPAVPVNGPGSSLGVGSALMPRRWGPNGSSSSRMAGPLDCLASWLPTAPLHDDGDGVASGAWYDHDARLTHSQKQHWHGGNVSPSQQLEPMQEVNQTLQQRGQQQEQAEDPSSSHMYYSADYYATSPYYGIDEYAMYGGGGSFMCTAGLPPSAAPGSLPLLDIALHPTASQPPVQSQPHQQVRRHPQHPPQQIRGSCHARRQHPGEEEWLRQQAVAHSLGVQPGAMYLVGDSVLASGSANASGAHLSEADGGLMVSLSQSQSQSQLQVQSHLHASGLSRPLNESCELRDRVAQGHALLQSLYESSR